MQMNFMSNQFQLWGANQYVSNADS
jgi:hypothetical protein